MARLVWKGNGRLKAGSGSVYYDEDISDEIQAEMGKDRIAALKKKGKIGDQTDKERIDKIRAKASAKAARAAKAGPVDEPATRPRGEKVGPKG